MASHTAVHWNESFSCLGELGISTLWIWGLGKKGRKRKHLHTQCVPFSTECACCLCLTSKFIQTNSWHLQGNSSPPAGNQRQGYGNDKIGRHIKVKKMSWWTPHYEETCYFPPFQRIMNIIVSDTVGGLFELNCCTTNPRAPNLCRSQDIIYLKYL